MVYTSELELGIRIVRLDHLWLLLWPSSISESNIRFNFDQWSDGQGEAVTAGSREHLPTLRGRQTQAAIDAAARSVIARKGILATTISDIAAEAGKSTASFYNYYDSKEAMVREWAQRFRDEARERAGAAAEPGLSNFQRCHEAAAAHWHTYRHQLAEMISVSQLAMVNDDFAQYWDDICALPIALITRTVKHAQQQGFCPDDDPHLVAVALLSMLNQFCYTQLAGDRARLVDDDACITTLANIFYRAIYHEGAT
jgi:AcrR family transcriptional regulator